MVNTILTTPHQMPVAARTVIINLRLLCCCLYVFNRGNVFVTCHKHAHTHTMPFVRKCSPFSLRFDLLVFFFFLRLINCLLFPVHIHDIQRTPYKLRHEKYENGYYYFAINKCPRKGKKQVSNVFTQIFLTCVKAYRHNEKIGDRECECECECTCALKTNAGHCVID